MNNVYTFPYLIKCEQPNRNLSFHDGIRWDSEREISEETDMNELREFYTRLFHRSGDKVNDLVVEKNGERIVLKWTMRYGKLSPRKCECVLDKKA
jgi:hypothetical protein